MSLEIVHHYAVFVNDDRKAWLGASNMQSQQVLPLQFGPVAVVGLHGEAQQNLCQNETLGQ